MEEIEVKYINIKPKEVFRRLKELGAKKLFDILYRKSFWDYPDSRLEKENRWLRLRDEGEQIRLTYKKVTVGKHIEETDVGVTDFELTKVLLASIGLKERSYCENKRTRYLLGDVECNVDTYPLIPPYLEIEAPSWKKLEETAVVLQVPRKDRRLCSVTEVYKEFGIREPDYKILTFKEQVKK